MKSLHSKLSLREDGGKAFKLSLLIRKGFTVKPGYTLTATETRRTVKNQKEPRNVRKSVARLKNAASLGVAVRSSAIGEDDERSSWAGQFTSKLFVKPSELASAVIACNEAGEGQGIFSYASLRRVNVAKLRLFIQEMVNARVSGVLFTRDPKDKEGTIILIEAVEGVAEHLASGRLAPRRYYVDEETGKIVKTEGAESPDLTESEIKNLVSLGKQIRALFGGKEQDIEWAIERGTEELFTNQARDITVSYGCPVTPPIGSRERVIQHCRSQLQSEREHFSELGCSLLPDVLSNQNIEELLTAHPSCMAFRLFTKLFAHEGAIASGRNEIGYEIGDELSTGFFTLVGGRPRCSIIHDAFSYRIRGIPLRDYCKLVNHYLERIKRESDLANYPEVFLYEQNPSRKFLANVFGEKRADDYFSAYQSFSVHLRVFEETLVSDYKAGRLTRWTQALAREELPQERLALKGLAERYDRVLHILRTAACPAFVKVARLGFFAYARLRNLVTELFGKRVDEYLGKLTSGIPRALNPNLEFVVHLYEYRKGNIPLAAIVKRYGHLAAHELEISVPRYRDQPALLEQLAKIMTADPETELTRNNAESIELQGTMIKEAGNRGKELAREINMARTYLPLREVVKFEYLKGYALLRQIALRVAQEIACDPEIVFWFDPSDISSLFLRNVKTCVADATRRRSYALQDGEVYVPTVLREDELHRIGQLPKGMGETLRGIGVTNVVSEGKIVVIHDINDKEAISKLCRGSILVTATTDPSWSPFLSVVGPHGGLVTEIGGILAHGAIYAREIGIAAVLNVPSATRILTTGMRVRVDSRRGLVTILG